MTACKDSLSGKKAVSATLAGVLAVGMVPAAAFAAEAPADEVQNDGIELLDTTSPRDPVQCWHHCAGQHVQPCERPDQPVHR